jgi:hypothetical protein
MASMVDCSELEASGLAEKLNKDDSLWCVSVAARHRRPTTAPSRQPVAPRPPMAPALLI